ncbi:hypothetical protein [uncultured Gammaproteobacteria bacterium]|nr:hypothetical protein [uncultured Gammaproteobacteria bacterium]CAC9998607.1 hypothetical protein [uncultured Gammaproteobacteria bacterium]
MSNTDIENKSLPITTINILAPISKTKTVSSIIECIKFKK